MGAGGEGLETALWYEPWEDGHTCGVAVNGVRLYQPNCKTAEECARALVESYRGELERQRNERKEEREEEKDPVEEFLRQYPELEVFGREWVRQWLYFRYRLVELAKAFRRYPWMAAASKELDVRTPWAVVVLEALDGSEACIGNVSSKVFLCTSNGRLRKVEMEYARLEQREGRVLRVYRPKGLMAYAAGAKEYVAVL